MKAPLPASLSVLALLAAAPAFAQGQTAGRGGQATGLCGQTVALTYSLTQPIDLSSVSPLALNIVRGEPLYLEFQLSEAARFVARTTTDNPDGDPFLTIYNAAGDVVTSDDDTAGGYDSMVDSELAPGTYCAQVRPLTGSSQEPLLTTLTLATGDAAAELAATATAGGGNVDYSALCSDPTMTTDLGTAIGAGLGTITRDIMLQAGSRQDWQVTVSEDMPVQFDARSDDFDTVLTLVDENGSYIGDNDDGPEGTNSQLPVRLPPGSYCLSLTAYEGGSGNATLTVSDEVANPPAGPIGTACTDPSITQDFANSIAPGMGTQSVPVSIARNSRSDWRIEVTAPTEIQVDAKSTWFDTVLTLVDANGNVVVENDDGPLNTDSRITRTLQPGSYCLAVAGYGGDGGEGELVISDSPEPDPVDSGTVPGCSDPTITSDLGTTIDTGTGIVSIPANIPANTRQDWRMDVAEEVQLRMDANSNIMDTVLKLYDANGALIEENDDNPNGVGTNSRIERTLSPGSYCVSMEGFAGGEGTGELSLLVLGEAGSGTASGQALPEPDAIEDLGTLTTVLQSSAMVEDQTRWLSFTVSEPTGVRVDAVSASGGFTLRLLNESGEMLDVAEGYSGLTPTTLRTNLEPGKYIVAMSMNEGVTARLRNVVITKE